MLSDAKRLERKASKVLYGGSYRNVFSTEEDAKRNTQLFINWTPPDGFTFLHHWTRADGAGGLFVAEADSPEAILEAVSPWGTRLEFDLSPLLDVTEGVPIFMKVQEWMGTVE